MKQLEIRDLRKQYGEKEVIKRISYAVQEGEMIGLLGANGAGKSTSIRMITGIVEDCSKTELKEKYASEQLDTLEDIFLHITGKELRDEVTAS